jgi:hypothetical protein
MPSPQLPWNYRRDKLLTSTRDQACDGVSSLRGLVPVAARAQQDERAWRISREQFELLHVSAPTPTAIGLAIPAALESCNCSCIGRQ